EVNAARLDEDVLDLQILDPKDEDVVEPLSRLGIERVGPAAAVETEGLAGNLVLRPALDQLLRHLGQRERERVEILHRRHGCDTNTTRRGAGAVERGGLENL